MTPTGGRLTWSPRLLGLFTVYIFENMIYQRKPSLLCDIISPVVLFELELGPVVITRYFVETCLTSIVGTCYVVRTRGDVGGPREGWG